MNTEQLREQIHAGIDRHCAPLTSDPYLVQRVLKAANKQQGGMDEYRENAKNKGGGLNMKKKMCLCFVLVLVLILSSITAFALLSNKDFIKQYVAPMSTDTTSNMWTAEEIDTILSLASENGLELPPNVRSAMEATDPIYKEQLMRLLMKVDFGESPAQWPIEEQAWYDTLLVQYGLQSERTRFLPEGNEISEETALEISIDYVWNTWNVDVSDKQKYQRYIQFMLTTDESGLACKRWDIEYEADDGTFYVVSLTPEGMIDESEWSTYIHAPEGTRETNEAVVPEDIWALAALMREDAFYNVVTLASFKARYEELITQAGQQDHEDIQLMHMLLAIPYTLPHASDITEENALSVARDAALQNGWKKEWLNWCKYSISYRQYEEEPAVYRVCYKLKATDRALFYRGEMPFGIVIYINPADGTVANVIQLTELDDFENYCEFPDRHDLWQNPGLG